MCPLEMVLKAFPESTLSSPDMDLKVAVSSAVQSTKDRDVYTSDTTTTKYASLSVEATLLGPKTTGLSDSSCSKKAQPLSKQQAEVETKIEQVCNDLPRMEAWIRNILTREEMSSAQFRVDLRDLLTFFRDECNPECPLRHVLTVTGSPLYAFAGTAESYVMSQWGKRGLEIFDWMSQVLIPQGHSKFCLSSFKV